MEYRKYFLFFLFFNLFIFQGIYIWGEDRESIKDTQISDQFLPGAKLNPVLSDAQSSLEKGMKSLQKALGKNKKTKFKERKLFPLKIRGGGNLSISFVYNDKNQNGFVLIVFNKSKCRSGKNGENLKPGEGAWVDRPLNVDEPFRIVYGFINFNILLNLKTKKYTWLFTQSEGHKWSQCFERLSNPDYVSEFQVCRIGDSFYVGGLDPILSFRSIIRRTGFGLK